MSKTGCSDYGSGLAGKQEELWGSIPGADGKVKAFRYNGHLRTFEGEYYVPDWAVKAVKDGILFHKFGGDLYLKHVGGGATPIEVGDYIVSGWGGSIEVHRGEGPDALHEPIAKEPGAPIVANFMRNDLMEIVDKLLTSSHKVKITYEAHGVCLVCQIDATPVCNSATCKCTQETGETHGNA